MATITKLEKYNGQSWTPYDLGVTVNNVELVSSIDKNLGCSSLDEWTKLIGDNFKLDSGASTATMVVKNINAFDTSEKQQIETGDTFDTVIGALNVALGSALNAVTVQSIATTNCSEPVKVGDTIDNIAGKINYLKYNTVKIMHCYTTSGVTNTRNTNDGLLYIGKGGAVTQYWKELYNGSGDKLQAVFDTQKQEFYVVGNKNSQGQDTRKQKLIGFFRVLPYKYTVKADNPKIINYSYLNVYRVTINNTQGFGVSIRNLNTQNDAISRIRCTCLVVETGDDSAIVTIPQ